MRPTGLAVAFALALAASPPASAALKVACGPPPEGAICADGPWTAFATMTVYAVQGESRSRYEITLGAGRDIKVAISENNPNYQGRAEAILIEGSVLAVREGLLPSQGQDLLGEPLLAAQEVAALLQATLPKGPKSVATSTAVKASGKRFVVASTPAMTTYYAPPWTVEGTVAPAGKEAYSFDLTFTAYAGTPDAKATARKVVNRYTGRASYPARRPRMSDATSLAGFRIDLPNGGTDSYPTLGAARRAMGIAPPN